MDEYIYYWPEKNVYCYRESLNDYVKQYGFEYECELAVDFF